MPQYQLKDKKKWSKDGRSWYFRCYYTNSKGETKQKKSKLFLLKKMAKEAEKDFLDKNDYSKKNAEKDNVTSNQEENNEIIREETPDHIVDQEENNEIIKEEMPDQAVDHEENQTLKFLDIYEEWLLLKKPDLKPASYSTLWYNVNKHVRKFVEKYDLNSFSGKEIAKWYEYLDGTKLCVKSKNRLIGYYGELISYAIDNYGLDKDVTKRIKRIKFDDDIENIVLKKDNFWTYDEFKYFIHKIDNRFYKLVFNFLYFTGMRIGEVQALTWNDIDLKNKRITITKSLTYNTLGKGYKITTPKTKNSFRFVDIPDNLLELLKEHKQHEEKLYGFNNDMFVFGNVKPMARTTLRNNLNKYIKSLGMTKITIHGFRHSHVSLLINLGCDARQVAKRIGDTVNTVEKTYYHMFPEKEKMIVNKLNTLDKDMDL